MLTKRALNQLNTLDDLLLLLPKAQLEKDIEALGQLNNSGASTLLKLESIEQAWPDLLPDMALQTPHWLILGLVHSLSSC